MKQVYATTSLPEAHALKSLLEGHGIEAVIENEGGAFYAVGMPSPALPLGLAVADHQAEDAARLLAEVRESEPLTAEDAAFAERVRRSRELSRRGWSLYLWMSVVVPLLAAPLLSLREDPRAAAAALAVLAAVLGVPLAILLLAKPRRRPISSENSPSA